MTRRVFFLLFPGCEILDVAGPVQAFFEAQALGASYAVQYCAPAPVVRSAQGLVFSDLQPLPTVTEADWVFVPGYPVQSPPPSTLAVWLGEAAATGARLCAVCTGAFLLGQAGLLHGRRCTTHWKRIAALQAAFPQAKVLDDRLYVEDGRIVTSAGIAAGIDMTLGLLSEEEGPALAAAVAREMVVYLRRDGSQEQRSVYLAYQEHLNAAVHQVQQYLVQNPASREDLAALAARVHVSPRHLTRLFRETIGISVGQYRTQLRLERAKSLLQQADLSLDAIAMACGFADVRQLRRIWTKQYGQPPSLFRKEQS